VLNVEVCNPGVDWTGIFISLVNAVPAILTVPLVKDTLSSFNAVPNPQDITVVSSGVLSAPFLLYTLDNVTLPVSPSVKIALLAILTSLYKLFIVISELPVIVYLASETESISIIFVLLGA
jgi:hypothetical protein